MCKEARASKSLLSAGTQAAVLVGLLYPVMLTPQCLFGSYQICYQTERNNYNNDRQIGTVHYFDSV